MARLDMGWHAHPRVLKLGLAAMGLHAWSISYCDHARSDGFIPFGAWPALPGAPRAVKTLVDAGLWTVSAPDGYVLHDYLQYNRSRAKIEADQSDAKVRQSRHRSRVTNGVTNGPVTEPVTVNATRDTRAPGRPGPGPGVREYVAAAAVTPGELQARATAAAAAANFDLPDEVRRRLEEPPIQTHADR